MKSPEYFQITDFGRCLSNATECRQKALYMAEVIGIKDAPKGFIWRIEASQNDAAKVSTINNAYTKKESLASENTEARHFFCKGDR